MTICDACSTYKILYDTPICVTANCVWKGIGFVASVIEESVDSIYICIYRDSKDM